MKSTLLCLLLLFANAAPALELTAFSGEQGGGPLRDIEADNSLGLEQRPLEGLIIGAPLSPTQDLELYYSRQQTRLKEGTVAVATDQLFDVEVHYLHLGGTVLSPRYYGWQGFLSGGLGVSHFSPSPRGGEAENRASLSLGVGAKWMPLKHVGIRLEGRLYGSLFNSSTSLFCGGGCELELQGDLLRQYAFFAGVVVRFD